MSSYLALHRATLTVPVMSPPPRWALTPPFHPYLSLGDQIESSRHGHRRFVFCGAGVGLLRLGVTQRPAHGVRTFLSTPQHRAITRPSQPHGYSIKKAGTWWQGTLSNEKRSERLWVVSQVAGAKEAQEAALVLLIDQITDELSTSHRRQKSSGNWGSFLINSHGFWHPGLQLIDSGPMAGMGRQKFRLATAG